MKKTLTPLIILILFNAGIAFAQNTITHASISFKIKNLGMNANGTIGGLQAKIKFNPADLAASKLEATVDVNTLNTNNSTRDEHLREEKFFDLAHYPAITLKSISFKHQSGNNYTGLFNLTIKNKTKQVEIPFTYVDKGATIAFNAAFKINRLDFGVGGNSFIMSDDVYITIDAEAGK